MASNQRTTQYNLVVDASQAEAEFKKLGAASENSTKAATASMNSMQAATAGIGPVTRTAAAQLAALNEKQRDLAATVRQTAQRLNEYALSAGEAAKAGNAQQYEFYREKVRQTATELNSLTSQQQANTVVQKGLQKETDTSGNAFLQLTTRVNTGRGALQGYDALVEALVRSMGGIPIAAAVAISILAALVTAFTRTKKAKEEQIEVDIDLIAADIALAQAMQGTERQMQAELNVRRDLQSLVQQNINARKELTEAERNEEKLTLQLNSAKIGLNNSTNILTSSTIGAGQATAVYTGKIEDLQLAVGQETKKRQEHTAEIVKTNEALIRNATQLGISRGELIRMAEAAGATGKRLEDFIQSLDRGTFAALEWASALQKVKLAQLDLANTSEAMSRRQADLNERIDAELKLGKSRIDVVSGNRNALQAELKAIQERITTQAAMNGEIIKEAEFRRRVRGEIAGLGLPLKDNLLLLEREADAVDKSSKKHKSATGAIKSHELALVDLNKKLQESRAALERDSVDRRIADVRADAEALRQKTIVQAKHSKERARTLESDLQDIAEIERNGIQKVLQAEEIERRKFLADQRETRREETERELKEFREKMVRQRQIRTEEQIRENEDEEKRQRVLRSNRPERRSAEAEERAQQRLDLENVITIFGRASESAELYAQQVALVNGELSTMQNITVALSSVTEQFTEDWIKSGQLFGQVAQGISDSLQAMVANGEDFGSNMKAVFLNLVAELASYFGRLFISIGSGMLFINPASGIGLIAAGTALIALAGVLRGLAQRSQQAARRQAETATANTGRSAATATGGAGVVPTNVIPFPTSGPGRGPQVFNIQLDRDGSKDFLDGKGVLTKSSVQGKDRHVIKKVVNQ
jgi:hypothetical protein